MKIQILNESKQSLGGGWSFIRNFKKILKDFVVEEDAKTIDLISKDADICFIASPSMVNRGIVEAAKSMGKKIVLRLDNIPRNSRNRGTGTPRLYDIAQMADLIIYQSLWAKNYLSPFIKKDGKVIYNGVDMELFNPEGPYKDFGKPDKKIYLYSRYNRDETKGWERAWFQFQMIHRKAVEAGTKAKLFISIL